MIEENKSGNEIQSELPNVIKMRKVACKILENGYNSIEMPYYFCNCDIDQKNPICLECAIKCHKEKGHLLSEIKNNTENEIREKVICECGMKGHQMDGSNKKHELYDPTCSFHEYSVYSKINVFYKGADSNVCIFCYKFCVGEQIANFTRTIAESSAKVPNCSCKNSLHNDVKNLYEKTNEIFKEHNNLESLVPAKFLNLIVKCEKTFKNVFYCFERYLLKLEENLDDPQYIFDENIHFSKFYNILNTFSVISKQHTPLKYYSENIKKYFNISLFCKILDKNVDFDFVGIMTFRKNFLDCVNRIVIGADFTLCPDFKISDIENMTPFQRLIINSNTRNITNFNTKYFKNRHKNVIDKLTNSMMNFTKAKFIKIIAYESFIKLTNLLKNFAKFGMFSHEQKLRYCVAVEEFFTKNLEFKKKFVHNEEDRLQLREYEIESFSGIVKTLICLAINSNDIIILNSLNPSSKMTEEKNFFHCKTELGDLIVKNCILLTNYIRSDIETNKKDDKKIKNILDLSTKLMNLSFTNPDFYFVGLRRSLNKIVDLYYKMINNEFHEDEDDKFFNLIQEKYTKMESSLFEYFNFNKNYNDLEKIMDNVVSEFFDYVGEDYKIPNLEKKSKLKKKSLSDENDNEIYENYRVIMNKSFFHFSVAKFINIFYNEINEITILKEKENKIIDKVLKVLYFYVEENPDNCLTALSSAALSNLSGMSGTNSDKILKFIQYCIHTLAINKYELSTTRKWLKYAHLAFVKSTKYENNNICLKILMDIIKIVLLKIPSLNHNSIIVDIRKYLKEILNETEFFIKVKKYLLDSVSNLSINEERKGSTLIIKNTSKPVDVKIADCESKLALKIFSKYLRLLNEAYDDNAMFNDNEFLSKFLSEEDLITILQNKKLNLNLRTEFLRYFRMVYVDVTINQDQIIEYRSQFCTPNEVEGDGLIKHEDLKVFFFLEKIMKISNASINTNIEYSVFLNELKNFESIFEMSQNDRPEHYLRYFEKGIILSLKVYLRKVFSVCYLMNGHEFLNIYKLSVYILKMKEYLLNNPHIVEKSQKEEKVFDSIWKKQEIKNLIIEKFSDKELKQLQKDLKKIQSETFQPLDYIAVYSIISKHFFGFISNADIDLDNESSINKFSIDKEKQQELYNKLKEKGLLNSQIQERIFDLIICYESYKYNESYFASNLSTIRSDHGANYKNLLLRFLFFFSKQINTEMNIDENVAKNEHLIILKLLQYDTEGVQKEIKNILECKGGDKTLKNVIDLPFLFDYCFKNIISVIFSSYNPSAIHYHDDYSTSCTLLKLFKNLCEGHNTYFQGLLMKSIVFDFFDQNDLIRENSGIINEVNEEEGDDKILGQNQDTKEIRKKKKVTFYDMILLILNKILILSHWEKVKDEDDASISYFYEIFVCLMDLLIEVVQGNETKNFSNLLSKNKGKTTNDKEFAIIEEDDSDTIKGLPHFLSSIKLLFFKDNTHSKLIYKIRKYLCDYLITFLEEKKCPSEIKSLIISNFYPQSVLDSIINTMKKYYLKMNEEDEEPQESLVSEGANEGKNINFLENVYTKKDKKSNKTLNFKKIKFNSELYQYLNNKYYQDEELSKSIEFEYSNTLYRYLKLLELEYENEEAKLIINSINEIEKMERLDFQKKGNKVNPDGKGSTRELNETQMERYFVVKFFESITRSINIQIENEKTPTRVIFTLNHKCTSLSDNTMEKFLEEVERTSRYHKLIELLNSKDAFFEEIEFNYLHLKDNIIMRQFQKINYKFLEFIAFLNALVLNFLLLGGLSVNDISGGSAKYQPYILWLNIQQILFNLLIFLIWMYSKFPLYYKIDKKMMIEKKYINSDELNVFTDLLYIKFYQTIFERNEVLMFLWNIICGIIGLILYNKYFIFAIQLLSVMNLSSTLKNITVALKIRFWQLLNTALLFIVILYMFAVIGYFFMPDDFYIYIGHKEETKVKEPACTTLLYCFLTQLNEGLRIRPGIGEFMFHKSYVYETKKYMLAWLYKQLFFVIVVVIMLNMVFGIIIDTFRELRKETTETEYDISNVCFICGVEKDQLEKENINYDNHISDEHYVWNYVYYMFGLKEIDEQDANAVTSYAIEKIKNKEISWFPSKNKVEEEEEKVDQYNKEKENDEIINDTDLIYEKKRDSEINNKIQSSSKNKKSTLVSIKDPLPTIKAS